MNKDFLYLGGLVLFLGAIGFYISSAPEAIELTYVPVDVGGGEISVEDQYDMSKVTLDAVLAAPGFITIHQSMGGAVADIIGISDYLLSGVNRNIEISLTEDMLPGYQYITLLHADNGDERYETMDDLPVKVDGQVIRPDFTADPDAVRPVYPGSEEAENQPDVNEDAG